jgi:plasmid maintenance system antidote protein VapI
MCGISDDRSRAAGALRLEKALGTSAGFWLNLQQNWDLYAALHSPKAAEIAKIRRVAEP